MRHVLSLFLICAAGCDQPSFVDTGPGYANTAPAAVTDCDTATLAMRHQGQVVQNTANKIRNRCVGGNPHFNATKCNLWLQQLTEAADGVMALEADVHQRCATL